MKKILLVLVLSLTMACLFAGNFNATLSGGYGYKSIKLHNDPDFSINTSALDAQVGLNYVFDNNVYVFGDFSMMFPNEVEAEVEDYKGKIKDSECDFSALAFTAGAGYKFDINENFQVLTGAGFRYENLYAKEKVTTVKDEITYMTLGVGLDVEGYYFFSDTFGAMAALKPNLGFYTTADTDDFKDDWMLSFSFNATAGLVVRF